MIKKMIKKKINKIYNLNMNQLKILSTKQIKKKYKNNKE